MPAALSNVVFLAVTPKRRREAFSIDLLKLTADRAADHSDVNELSRVVDLIYDICDGACEALDVA